MLKFTLHHIVFISQDNKQKITLKFVCDTETDNKNVQCVASGNTYKYMTN